MLCRKCPKKVSAATFSCDGEHAIFADKFGDVYVAATATPEQVTSSTSLPMRSRYCVKDNSFTYMPCPPPKAPDNALQISREMMAWWYMEPLLNELGQACYLILVQNLLAIRNMGLR